METKGYKAMCIHGCGFESRVYNELQEAVDFEGDKCPYCDEELDFVVAEDFQAND